MAATQAYDLFDQDENCILEEGKVGELRAVSTERGAESHALHAGVNVVSRLGAEVEPEAWQSRFPGQEVNEILIDHPSISSMHAALYFEGSGALLCFVKDLGSTNKTRIRSNGSLLTLQRDDRYKIDPGDKVLFGAVEYEAEYAQNGCFQETDGSQDASPMEEDAQAQESDDAGSGRGVVEGGPDQVKAPFPPPSPPLEAEQSPFAAPTLEHPPEMDAPQRTDSLGAVVGFGSVQGLDSLQDVTPPELKPVRFRRQLSLHDWCSSPKRGERQAKSLDIPRPVLNQTLNLTPHGSPKLAGRAPLFSPPAPRKLGGYERLSGRSRSIEEVVGRDVLSELLSCDESLGWNLDQGHDAKRSHWSGRPSIPESHLQL